MTKQELETLNNDLTAENYSLKLEVNTLKAAIAAMPAPKAPKPVYVRPAISAREAAIRALLLKDSESCRARAMAGEKNVRGMNRADAEKAVDTANAA